MQTPKGKGQEEEGCDTNVGSDTKIIITNPIKKTMGKLNKPHIFALLKPLTHSLTHSLTAMLYPNKQLSSIACKNQGPFGFKGGPPLTLVPTALLYNQ